MGATIAAPKQSTASKLEERLSLELKAVGLPEPVREYRFWPGRQFRFDFCWPDKMLAVEVEGGAFSGGRHSRGAGMTTDASKYNQAALMGWVVLRFTPPMIRSGEAIQTIETAYRQLCEVTPLGAAGKE